jgi:hypothetical protein
MNEKILTVASLIKLLKEMPKEAEVLLEGCDCYGRAGSVILSKSTKGQKLVTIKRLSE